MTICRDSLTMSTLPGIIPLRQVSLDSGRGGDMKVGCEQESLQHLLLSVMGFGRVDRAMPFSVPPKYGSLGWLKGCCG